MTEGQEPQVHGISKGDFQSWKHHPVSKIYLQFLADKRAFLQDAVMERWIAGQTDLQLEQTMRGQIVELFEIENMMFEDMAAFYQMEEDNSAEVNQD